MGSRFKNILIISDIEGSSGCWSYQASSFLTDEWSKACLEMTRDVNIVGQALLDAGVEHITVKDFHRTGFNLLSELIDSRIRVVSGYRPKPVPGIGDPGDARAVMFLGMHAASGTPGFLAHTLTSRVEQLQVNGKPMAEVELFAASLSPFGIRPIFFSGCPIACNQAQEKIDHIRVHPIDKSMGTKKFEVHSWRTGLARAAVESLENDLTAPYQPIGPFQATVRMRDGQKAAQLISKRWKFDYDGYHIYIRAADIHALYLSLIRLCYLTPLMEKLLPIGLMGYNLWGQMGQIWVRQRIKKLL